METEQIPSSPRRQRGMAMFAVLGAIVLVTLLGAVGLTLAEKDQRLSGDFAALKSADEMGLAGLRLAVNRLEADPANLVTLLNDFIRSQGKSQWLNLSGATVTLQASAPSTPFSLNTDPNDKSSANVRILGVSPGDTGNFPTMDSGMVYVTLECQATGMHNDQRTTTATYHIQGLSLAFSSTIRQFRMFNYALYLGGRMETSDMAADLNGDVYVNGSGGTFMNGGSNQTVHGVLKWNGDFRSNAPLTVDSNAFIRGTVYLNGGDDIRFKKNLGIGGGFLNLDSKLTVDRNLWVGSTQPVTTGDWHSGGQLSVGGDFVFVPSSANTSGGAISVGGNAWMLSGVNIGAPLTIGKSLYVRDSGALFPFKFALGGALDVGKNLFVNAIPTGTVKFQLSSASAHVGDSLFTLLKIDGGTIVVDSGYYATVIPGAHLTNQIGRVIAYDSTTMGKLYAPPPTLAGLGLTDTSTSLAANPMDSVQLDSINSPEAYSHIVEVTSRLLTDASITGTKLDPPMLNRLYAYLDSTHRLFNGYMVLRLGPASVSAITGSNDDLTGFTGKAIFKITASNTNLGDWPHSHDSTNIQVIDIQPGGNVGQWGWTNGDFAGIFYWSDPPHAYCNTVWKFKMPAPPPARFFRGSIIIGHSTSCASGQAGPKVTPDGGPIQITRSAAVFLDIGKNLPGVLRPATYGLSSPRDISSTTAAVMSPFVRQTTSKPYFQTIGIYR